SPRTGQLRQEGLGYAIGAEEVDGEVPFERGTIAQVVVERDAGVVDEDIERFDVLDGCLNLRRIGDVEGQRRDPRIRVNQGLPRTGIDPSGATEQGLLDERLADAAIGPGDQNGAA